MRKRRRNWNDEPTRAEYEAISHQIIRCHDSVVGLCPHLQDMTDELYAHLASLPCPEQHATFADIACCYVVSAKFMCSHPLRLKTVCRVMRPSVKAVSRRKILAREASLLRELGWNVMCLYNRAHAKLESAELVQAVDNSHE